MILDDVKDVAFALTADERARLARELIASLDDAGDEDAEHLWHLETSRRIAEIESGAVQPVDAELVIKRARDRLEHSN